MTPIYSFIEHISDPLLIDFLKQFEQTRNQYFSDQYHGDFSKWNDALKNLLLLKKPDKSFSYNLNSKAVTLAGQKEFNAAENGRFKKLLQQFMPWRKGPFELFGIYINAEWRSDLKWDRLKTYMSDLKDRNVLDIGCGNGFYCWRMLGAGAKTVLGIDPMLLYVMQFHIFKGFINKTNIEVLPLSVEQLPADLKSFETVFSMGVLYHQRSPFDHLLQLRDLAVEGGEIVLETLVINGTDGQVLVPNGRYAKMRNVWFIPSILTLEGWLRRCGLKNIRVIDVTQTTSDEQRKTDWMIYESLQDFLDPIDKNKTIEGYPGPTRAIFICNT